MYFVCCCLSCQTVFHVISDWLYSFGVVIGCDMNAKVFVLAKLCSAIPEGTVFFFTNQELLQHRVHDFSSLGEITIQ